MALRVLLSERYGAEEPPWHGGGKVMSRPDLSRRAIDIPNQGSKS